MSATAQYMETFERNMNSIDFMLSDLSAQVPVTLPMPFNFAAINSVLQVTIDTLQGTRAPEGVGQFLRLRDQLAQLLAEKDGAAAGQLANHLQKEGLDVNEHLRHLFYALYSAADKQRHQMLTIDGVKLTCVKQYQMNSTFDCMLWLEQDGYIITYDCTGLRNKDKDVDIWELFKDEQIDASIGLKYLLTGSVYLRPRVTYTRNFSNIALYDFKRWTASLGVRFEFRGN